MRCSHLQLQGVFERIKSVLLVLKPSISTQRHIEPSFLGGVTIGDTHGVGSTSTCSMMSCCSRRLSSVSTFVLRSKGVRRLVIALGFTVFFRHMKFDLGIFQLAYVMEKSRIFLPALVFVCCSVYNVNKLELGCRLVAKQRTMFALRNQESVSLYQRCCFHCKNAFTKYVYWGILTISMYL